MYATGVHLSTHLRPCNLDQDHRGGDCLSRLKDEHIGPRNGEKDAMRQQQGLNDNIRGEEYFVSKHEHAKTRNRKRKRSFREKGEDVGSSDAS